MNPRTAIPAAIAAVFGAGRLLAARLRHGRPGILAARLAGADVLAEITVHSGAGPAPVAGTLTGIVTWLVLTARGDFAPPSGR